MTFSSFTSNNPQPNLKKKKQTIQENFNYINFKAKKISIPLGPLAIPLLTTTKIKLSGRYLVRDLTGRTFPPDRGDFPRPPQHPHPDTRGEGGSDDSNPARPPFDRTVLTGLTLTSDVPTTSARSWGRWPERCPLFGRANSPDKNLGSGFPAGRATSPDKTRSFQTRPEEPCRRKDTADRCSCNPELAWAMCKFYCDWICSFSLLGLGFDPQKFMGFLSF